MEDNALLKQVQEVGVGMLKELDRLCRRHGIAYFLGGGTLLGAVRQGGFIPWDDDIDVVLLRKDYDHLMKVLSEELDPRYFLQTFETEPAYRKLYAKIRCHGTLFMEWESRNHPIHQGIFLDIFPLDSIPDSAWDRKLHKNALMALEVFRLSADLDIVRSSTSPLRRTVGYAMFPLAKLIAHRPYLRFAQKVASRYQAEDTACVSDLYGGTLRWYDHPKLVRAKELYEKAEHRTFEGLTVPVPAGWHECLSAQFGPDYMTPLPPDKRKPSHNVIRIEIGTAQGSTAADPADEGTTALSPIPHG